MGLVGRAAQHVLNLIEKRVDEEVGYGQRAELHDYLVEEAFGDVADEFKVSTCGSLVKARCCAYIAIMAGKINGSLRSGIEHIVGVPARR